MTNPKFLERFKGTKPMLTDNGESPIVLLVWSEIVGEQRSINHKDFEVADGWSAHDDINDAIAKYKEMIESDRTYSCHVVLPLISTDYPDYENVWQMAVEFNKEQQEKYDANHGESQDGEASSQDPQGSEEGV